MRRRLADLIGGAMCLTGGSIIRAGTSPHPGSHTLHCSPCLVSAGKGFKPLKSLFLTKCFSLSKEVKYTTDLSLFQGCTKITKAII